MFVQIPGESKVVACIVEEIIPAARHWNLAWSRQCLEPALRFTLLFGIHLELPEAGEVEQVADLILLWVEQAAASRYLGISRNWGSGWNLSGRVSAPERPGPRRRDGGERNEVSLAHRIEVGTCLISNLFV